MQPPSNPLPTPFQPLSEPKTHVTCLEVSVQALQEGLQVLRGFPARGACASEKLGGFGFAASSESRWVVRRGLGFGADPPTKGDLKRGVGLVV